MFVTSFPPGGGKWQISDGGGSQPKWSRDGRELFFRSDDGVMSARVAAEGSSLRAGKPDLVFRGPFLGGIRGLLLPGFNFPDYDVAGDGRRFVMFTGGGSKKSASRARVVLELVRGAAAAHLRGRPLVSRESAHRGRGRPAILHS